MSINENVVSIRPDVSLAGREGEVRHQHRWNTNLVGVLKQERDGYRAHAHGLRLDFLLDSDVTANGYEVFKIYPIYFEKPYFENRRYVDKEVLYDRPAGDSRIMIPLAHVLGFGEQFLEWPELESEERDLGDEMIQVLHAALALTFQRHLRDQQRKRRSSK